MPPKAHRVLLGRLSGYADEAVAYLHRRRQTGRPFARVYVAGGHGATYPPESDAGRKLFLAAARLIEVEGRE